MDELRWVIGPRDRMDELRWVIGPLERMDGSSTTIPQAVSILSTEGLLDITIPPFSYSILNPGRLGCCIASCWTGVGIP